jgi:hypothetical protein
MHCAHMLAKICILLCIMLQNISQEAMKLSQDMAANFLYRLRMWWRKKLSLFTCHCI